MEPENIGSSLDDFLDQEGIFDQVSNTTTKRVLVRQIATEMARQNLSKAAMAKRMHTSRAALDRLLDPENDAVTLNTLYKAAAAIGRQVQLQLV